MHGELIEFNERLHRALVAKEALVSQMRQELIDLRGPVSAPTWEGPRLALLPVFRSHTVKFAQCWQCQGDRKSELSGTHLPDFACINLLCAGFALGGNGKNKHDDTSSVRSLPFAMFHAPPRPIVNILKSVYSLLLPVFIFTT